MPAAAQLVGRPAELDAFDRCSPRSDGGSPAAVTIVGEPGIGKTRLLAELAARADARGQLVLTGSASELERDLPFWVFVDALDEYAEGLDPRRLEQLDETARTELAHVLPLALGARQRWRRRAAGRALPHPPRRARPSGDAGCGKPLVLILDDLHWADSGTIELLGALLRSLPNAPVLLAMAMRAPPDARPTCGRVRARAPGRKAHASRARGPDAARDPAASRTWLRGCRGDRAPRGQRWQSVLPRATRPLTGASTGPRIHGPRGLARRGARCHPPSSPR